MMKLLKYEFRKTRAAKLILFTIGLILEALLLVNIFNKQADKTIIYYIFLVMLGIFGALAIGIQSIATLHQDMNTRQSYMLFMTPHTSYAILGAKVIECSLSIIFTGVIFFAVCTADVSLILKQNGEIEEIMDFFKQIVESLGENISLNFAEIAGFCFELLCSWLFTVNAAFLADILSASFLNGKRMNGLITFIFFLVITWLFSELVSLFFISSLFVRGAIYLIFAVGMYYLSAWMMDRYLSV